MADQPEACEEWQEDLAAWLVAQASPEREPLLLEHLATCATCRSEVDSLHAVAAVSLGTDPEGAVAHVDARDEPPADLGERIVARVASERRLRRAVVAAAAVAGAVAAAALVLVVLRPDGARLEGDQVEFAVVPEGATAEAVVAADDDGGSLVELVATGLDPGTTYALWLSPPGGGWDDRIAAGTFRPDSEGEVDVRLHCSLPAAQAGRVWATTPAGDLALDTE